jgi:hypothetical protein
MPDTFPYLEQWKRDAQMRQQGFKPGHSQHFERAKSELKLTPQEEYLYQHHLANLAKGGVRNPDGSVSTIFNITAEIEGKTYVLPTVWDNQIVSPDEAVKRAHARGLDKWPSYKTEDEASKRYDAMHGYMEQDAWH